MKFDKEDVKHLPKITDLEDLLQAAVARNAASHTILYEDMAIARTTTGEDTNAANEDAEVSGLVDNILSMHMALGEGRVAISLLYDEYAESISFPAIYLGVPYAISGPRLTPFSMAGSEICCTERRGTIPGDVLLWR
ncbi:hypothetical protein MRX96_019403 [Rhipicephalus microplus]